MKRGEDAGSLEGSEGTGDRHERPERGQSRPGEAANLDTVACLEGSDAGGQTEGSQAAEVRKERLHLVGGGPFPRQPVADRADHCGRREGEPGPPLGQAAQPCFHLIEALARSIGAHFGSRERMWAVRRPIVSGSPASNSPAMATWNRSSHCNNSW